MITGDAVHRHPDAREFIAKALVASERLVLDEVARRQNRLRRIVCFSRMRDYLPERRVRQYTAHATFGVRVKVRVNGLAK